MKASQRFAHAGEFIIAKLTRTIRGRNRKVRVLQFKTKTGEVGESRRFDHKEAYEAAMACQVRLREAAVCPKPAPVAPLLGHMDTSDLCSELERRGYEIVVAESPTVAEVARA